MEINRDTGNVHYEEVYLDENGNEVVVPVADRENNDDEEENGDGRIFDRSLIISCKKVKHDPKSNTFRVCKLKNQ